MKKLLLLAAMVCLAQTAQAQAVTGPTLPPQVFVSTIPPTAAPVNGVTPPAAAIAAKAHKRAMMHLATCHNELARHVAKGMPVSNECYDVYPEYNPADAKYVNDGVSTVQPKAATVTPALAN